MARLAQAEVVAFISMVQRVGLITFLMQDFINLFMIVFHVYRTIFPNVSRMMANCDASKLHRSTRESINAGYNGATWACQFNKNARRSRDGLNILDQQDSFQLFSLV